MKIYKIIGTLLSIIFHLFVVYCFVLAGMAVRLDGGYPHVEYLMYGIASLGVVLTMIDFNKAMQYITTKDG